MRKNLLIFIVLVISTVATTAATPLPSQRAAAIDLLQSFDRTPLGGSIAHYQLDVRVGPGQNDRIRLHRVVKEKAPYSAMPSDRALLLAHGDRWGFAATFLTSLATDAVPDEQAMPIFLAQNGIDVWGIDFRWALVPSETEDLSFMKDWNLETDADDLGRALWLARGIRAVTGSDFSKLHLAGFSRGGQASYVYLGKESQRPLPLHQVRGFIPLDIALVSDDDDVRQRACERHADLQMQIADGTLVASTSIFQLLADLARTEPEEPSPFFPPYTNRQLALDIGTFPRSSGVAPFFHSVGGLLTDDLIPLGLRFSIEDHFFAFLAGQAFHQPMRIFLQAEAILCGEIETPLDDHLAEINVPVFYVGAGGGFGEFGVYNTTLLASNDVTTLVVSLDEDRLVDLGHQELFLADDAEVLFWHPILDWIVDH